MSEPQQPRRSSRWMTQTLHVLLVAILLVVVGFRIYGYFATSETELAAHKNRMTAQSLQQLRTTAHDAFQREDWEQAAEAYAEITEKDNSNIRARVRLAYALHHSGQQDRALAEFLAVCRFEGVWRQWALYNIACVYALKGDKRLALDYLGEAADEGFRTRQPIDEDPDLASLVDDPEFKLLAEKLKPISRRDVYHRFDFLIGNWKLLDENDRRVGSLSVRKEGYTLLGEYAPEATSSRMTLFAFYDPGISDWRQLWLDMHGTVIQLRGDESNGHPLVFHGRHAAAEGETRTARATYTDGIGGIVHLELAISNDEGATWLRLLDAALLPLQIAEDVHEAVRNSPPQ